MHFLPSIPFKDPMKFNRFNLTLAAVASAALVASCGGGDGGTPAATGGTPAPATPTGVVLTGTAAVGLALANAPVSVKCASGTGTATTDANGVYTITVTDGALPCMIAVTATVDGNTVTLHSIAEAGTTANGTTTARTNVTPLTELIAASVLGQSPAAAFQSFTGTGVTAEKVESAVTAIKQAIKDATGVDLGSIDPLKANLVAATGSTTGDTYDKALDAIAEKIPTQSVVQMAEQVANNATGGADAIAQALSFAEGCPSAVSGRYRALGLTGEVILGTFDFKGMSVKFDGHESSAQIAQNPDQACDFSIGTSTFDSTAENRFAIGPQGAGGFSGNFFLGSDTPISGYLFPVQTRTPDFAGAASASPWLFVQSGLATDENPARVNWLSQLTFASDGKVTVCDYSETTNFSGECTSDGTPGVTHAAASSDGVELLDGTTPVARFWSFRAPSGSTTLYGTTRVSATTLTSEMTSFIMTRQTALALPAVGTKSRSLTFTAAPNTSFSDVLFVRPASMSAFTIDSVDQATGKFSRSGVNGTTAVTGEEWLNNKPQNGLRRAATSETRIQVPVVGAGITVSISPTKNVATQQNPNASNFTHSISVGVPTTTPSGDTAPGPTAQVQ
jgi:hypothetical protein